MPFARVIPACVASAVPYESSSNDIPWTSGETGGWPLGVPRLRRSGVRASINAGALRRGEGGDTHRRRGQTIDNRALFSSSFSHPCGNSGRERSINTRGPPELEIPSADGSMLIRALSSSLVPAPLFRPDKLFFSATLRRSSISSSFPPRPPSSRNMSGFTQVRSHRLPRRPRLIPRPGTAQVSWSPC